MKITFKFSIIIILCCAQGALAQKNDTFIFKSGDRVCFIGNSITNNGEFYNNIFLYAVTRFPQSEVQFYNCGISGDNAAGVLRRLDKDILIHQPTWSVIMLGMNDVIRSLYKLTNSSDPNTAKRKQNAIEVYKKNLELIVKKLLASHSQVILEKPTIYDQTAKLPSENLYGVNDALKICSDYIQMLADQYGLRTIDYYGIMNQLNDQLQKKDSTATLTGPDRIHPGSLGHLIMSYQFLRSTHAPKEVAKIVIGKNIRQSEKASVHCAITGLRHDQNGLLFSCLENALPFPKIPSAAGALDLVPFNDEFNQEILQVKKLENGRYDLMIDGKLVDSYSNESLSVGINLAVKEKTPQYQQSIKLLDLCRKYRNVEANLRGLKFVEHYALSDLSEKDITDTNKVKLVLKAKSEEFKDSPYFLEKFKSYLAGKVKQESFEQDLKEIHNEIFKVNKPVQHTYELVKKN